jgi:hypothetical protein
VRSCFVRLTERCHAPESMGTPSCSSCRPCKTMCTGLRPQGGSPPRGRRPTQAAGAHSSEVSIGVDSRPRLGGH